MRKRAAEACGAGEPFYQNEPTEPLQTLEDHKLDAEAPRTAAVLVSKITALADYRRDAFAAGELRVGGSSQPTNSQNVSQMRSAATVSE